MCESVGWWCSNLNTYGKSLSFPLVHFFLQLGGEGKNEFSKCVILYAQFDIFSIHFDCSLFLSLLSPACCGCSGGMMMIVILVRFTTGGIVVTMINVETEIIDTLKVFSPSREGSLCSPSPMSVWKLPPLTNLDNAPHHVNPGTFCLLIFFHH